MAGCRKGLEAFRRPEARAGCRESVGSRRPSSPQSVRPCAVRIGPTPVLEIIRRRACGSYPAVAAANGEFAAESLGLVEHNLGRPDDVKGA
jgi:hypothetical protein